MYQYVNRASNKENGFMYAFGKLTIFNNKLMCLSELL